MQLNKFLHSYPIDNLSEKEMAILRCLVDGDTDKQIANRTGINISVLRTHLLKSLFQKLGVRNRTQAAVLGWLNGFGEEKSSP